MLCLNQKRKEKSDYLKREGKKTIDIKKKNMKKRERKRRKQMREER